jgi:hypothetical protein
MVIAVNERIAFVTRGDQWSRSRDAVIFQFDRYGTRVVWNWGPRSTIRPGSKKMREHTPSSRAHGRAGGESPLRA